METSTNQLLGAIRALLPFHKDYKVQSDNGVVLEPNIRKAGAYMVFFSETPVELSARLFVLNCRGEPESVYWDIDKPVISRASVWNKDAANLVAEVFSSAIFAPMSWSHDDESAWRLFHDDACVGHIHKRSGRYVCGFGESKSLGKLQIEVTAAARFMLCSRMQELIGHAM